jgi:hypothetical protein
LPLPGGQGFSHNTVARNGWSGGSGIVGGIVSVSSTTIPIANSIIYGNSKTQQGGSQLSGNLQLTYVDIDDTVLPSGLGNRNLPVDYVSTNSSPFDVPNFRLAGRTTNNLACCVDQIPSSIVDHDFDGTKRPINVKFDIGAHEVP